MDGKNVTSSIKGHFSQLDNQKAHLSCSKSRENILIMTSTTVLDKSRNRLPWELFSLKGIASVYHKYTLDACSAYVWGQAACNYITGNSFYSEFYI